MELFEPVSLDCEVDRETPPSIFSEKDVVAVSSVLDFDGDIRERKRDIKERFSGTGAGADVEAIEGEAPGAVPGESPIVGAGAGAGAGAGEENMLEPLPDVDVGMGEEEEDG